MALTSREPGAPVTAGEIPLCVPHLGGREWDYVRECLDTNMVSSVGPFVGRFERAVADFVGAPYAVATVNGTAALHLALIAAGVRPDDEVLVSTLSFIAPANAIRYTGAWPVFVDAEPRYWQMDCDKLADFLANECTRDGRGEVHNRATGRHVSAILPVHVLGHPVDLDPVLRLAEEYGLVVIEDATESLGARYHGRPTGTLGRSGCFSFNGNKLITTGGGGMLVTGDEATAVRAKYLSTQAKDNAVEFIHGAVGYNYRLTNVAAAIGCAQMEALGEHVAVKRRIAARYGEALADVPGVRGMAEAEWADSACWLYTITINEAEAGVGSRALLARLESQGIQTRPLWQPLHRSPAHTGAPATDCSTAERIAACALSLPCSVGLSDAEQDRVVEAVRGAVGGGARG